MAFLLYLTGFVVLISGAAWLATLAGIAQSLVTGGALALLAVGIITALSRARESDPA
jgi:positive regulator of sigma E activity